MTALCKDECKRSFHEKKIINASDMFIKQIDFSENGKFLLAAQGDKKLSIYDTISFQLLDSIQHPSLVLACNFGKKQNIFASASWDQVIRIYTYEIEEEEIINSKKQNLNDGEIQNDYQNTQNLENLENFQAQNQIQMEIKYRIKNIQLQTEIKNSHKDWIPQIQFIQNDRYIISVSGDRNAALWNVETGEQIDLYQAHEQAIFGLAISETQNYMATSGADQIICIWDISQPQKKKLVQKLENIHSDCISSILFYGEHEELLISAGWDNMISLTNWKQKKILFKFQAHDQPISNLDISKLFLISASEDMSIKVWDLNQITDKILGLTQPLRLKYKNENVQDEKEQIKIKKLLQQEEQQYFSQNQVINKSSELQQGLTIDLDQSQFLFQKIQLSKEQNFIWNVKVNPSEIRQIATADENGNLSFWRFEKDINCFHDCMNEKFKETQEEQIKLQNKNKNKQYQSHEKIDL